MNRLFVAAFVASLIAVPAMADRAFDGPSDVNTTQRGSLLYWPDVEVKFDENDNVVMDTFIELTNDGPQSVDVQLYFVQGDDPEQCEELSGTFPPIVLDRTHPGCNYLDTQIRLTPNNPTYWSSATGNHLSPNTFPIDNPVNVVPFPNLDPGDSNFGPGRQDPDDPNLRTVRGFVVGWAVQGAQGPIKPELVEVPCQVGVQITWNWLTGSALKVSYGSGAAWEYNATRFQRLYDPTDDGDDGGAENYCGALESFGLGNPTDEYGVLYLDGEEYDRAPGRLQLDFYAVATTLSSGANTVDVANTDISLLPTHQIFTRNRDQFGEDDIPYTYVQADIWNQNEIRFSGTARCICCWDQTLLSSFQFPGSQGSNHFLEGSIRTDKGKARLTGFADFECAFGQVETSVGSGVCEPYEVSSRAYPLLGVAVKIVDFGDQIGLAGSTLNYHGWDDSGTIEWDVVEAAQELNDDVQIITPAKGLRKAAPIRNLSLHR